MKLQDVQKLAKLPPRKFGAEVLKLTRKALREGDCGGAVYFLHLGQTRKIVKSAAFATLKARIDRCYIGQRGGTV